MEKKKCNHCKGEGKHRVSDTDWHDCVSCNGEGFIIIQPSPVSLDTHTAEEEIIKGILDTMSSCTIGDNPMKLYLEPSVVAAMTEYSSLRENEIIDKCKQIVKEYRQSNWTEIQEQLEKLKKPSL